MSEETNDEPLEELPRFLCCEHAFGVIACQSCLALMGQPRGASLCERQFACVGELCAWGGVLLASQVREGAVCVGWRAHGGIKGGTPLKDTMCRWPRNASTGTPPFVKQRRGDIDQLVGYSYHKTELEDAHKTCFR